MRDCGRTSVEDLAIRRSLCLFWGLFALNVLNVLSFNEEETSAPLINYASWICFFLLVMLGLRSRGACEREFAPLDRLLVVAFALLTGFALVTGAVASGFRPLDAVRQVSPFLGVALVFSPLASASGLRRVVRAAVWQGPLILLVVIAIGYRFPTYLSFWQSREISAPHFAAQQLAASCGGLLACPLGGTLYLVLGMAGYVAPVWIGIAAQTRSFTVTFLGLNAVLAPIVFAVRGTVSAKEVWKRLQIRVVVGGLVLVSVVSLLLWVAQSDGPIGAIVSRTYARFTGGDLATGTVDLQHVAENEQSGRVAESLVILDSLTPMQWILGHGYGAPVESRLFGFTNNFAHIGPTAMLMKGGVFYSVAFMMLILRALWHGGRYLRDPLIAACFLIVADRLLMFLIHSGIDQGYGAALLWIAIGALLRCGRLRGDTGSGKVWRAPRLTRFRTRLAPPTFRPYALPSAGPVAKR